MSVRDCRRTERHLDVVLGVVWYVVPGFDRSLAAPGLRRPRRDVELEGVRFCDENGHVLSHDVELPVVVSTAEMTTRVVSLGLGHAEPGSVIVMEGLRSWITPWDRLRRRIARADSDWMRLGSVELPPS